MAVLIDTNVLLAFAFSRDSNHQSASNLLETLRNERRMVPAPVLNELFYMTMVRIHYRRAIQVFAHARTAFEIVALTASDMLRMEQIMSQYEDAALDFTDVAILAMAERLNISRICTFDRRDFLIYRPQHCDFLELLPTS